MILPAMIRNGILIGVLLTAVSLGCATASPAKKGGALMGSWGGLHIGLELTAKGGTLEYDCAHGPIDEPGVPDRDGRFEAAGTHTAGHHGPIREGEQTESRRARYRGKVDGETLVLTVTLVDSKEEIGTFTLTRGAPPRITHCM